MADPKAAAIKAAADALMAANARLAANKDDANAQTDVETAFAALKAAIIEYQPLGGRRRKSRKNRKSRHRRTLRK
uniref:Uncharacterized protein n=1 Tax=viral metagenome TaxID=1070528 RepID=A0A6C0K8S6_9ZZZZ